MFSLALKYDTAELTGPHDDCDYTPAKYPQVLGLLSHLCDALEETGAVRFEVIAFADEPWPVDVRCDLSVVLKQVPEVLQAVRSPETREFELSFYEQGIERDLLFTKGPSNRIAVDFSTRLEWHPPRSVENIDTEALERQLVTLVEDFVRSARIVCPLAAGSQTFREWLAGMDIQEK